MRCFPHSVSCALIYVTLFAADGPVKKETALPVKKEPASPPKPMNGIKQEDDDDDDSIPLAQRAADLKRSAKPKAESDEEDEDTPLVSCIQLIPFLTRHMQEL